jgi:hypothetical protein
MILKSLLPPFFGALMVLGGTAARAELVRFAFEGTVTNRFNNGLPDASDIFGLSVNVGDAVHGSFTIDTAATVFGSAVGAAGGSAAGYTQVAPQDMQVFLAGGVFSSIGDFASSIANDYQDNPLFDPFEQFTVHDGVSSGSPNLTGDTILLDGSPETARMRLEFTDLDATAFDSTALPDSLNLADFEIAEGTISGTRPSGQFNPFFYQATFRVNSISSSVVAVPEPSMVAALCGVVAAVSLRNRRRHRRS